MEKSREQGTKPPVFLLQRWWYIWEKDFEIGLVNTRNKSVAPRIGEIP